MNIQSRFTFVLTVALTGCSAAGDLTSFTETVELPDAPARTAADLKQVRFTATPDAAPDLQLAVDRWVAAGVAPEQFALIPSGGIPAKYVPDCIPWPDGVCRRGGLTKRGIEVQVGQPDAHRIWTHEVGHVLGLPHLETAGADEIMYHGEHIGEATLQAACVLVYCDRWAPEVPAELEEIE